MLELKSDLFSQILTFLIRQISGGGGRELPFSGKITRRILKFL